MKRTAMLLGILVSVTLNAYPSIEYVRKNSIPLEPKEWPPALLKKVERYGVITIGEHHGTVEAPEFTYGLVRLLLKKKQKVVLGVEIPESEQSTVDLFRQTGDISILKASRFFSRSYQDGRSSLAMATLLYQLQNLRHLEVVTFDPVDSTSSQDRDEKMARNLKQAYEKYKPDHLVVLAGNIHSSISRGYAGNPRFRPMGYEMIHGAHAFVNAYQVLPIRVRNESGSAWVCFEQSCKAHPFPTGKSNYSQAVPWENYFLEEVGLEEGYKASLFTRQYHSSPPLVP